MTTRPPATGRLLLRRWLPGDREPFAELNADPEVMRHFPAALTRAQSDAFVDRAQDWLDAEGWGLWAVEPLEDPDAGRLAGFVGLNPAPEALPFAPAVEVGWRLARWAWGRGYATEAGAAALRFGFEVLGLEEIISFTAVDNEPSQAVMQRLGMTRDPAEDFEHPLVEEGHRLRPHVLYRLQAGGERTSPQNERSRRRGSA